eukprot:gene33942-43850_t
MNFPDRLIQIILVFTCFYAIILIVRQQIIPEKYVLNLKTIEVQHRRDLATSDSKDDIESFSKGDANFLADVSSTTARSNSQGRKKKSRWAKSLRAASSSKISTSSELHPHRGTNKDRGNNSLQLKAAQPAFDSDNSAYVAEVRLPVPNDYLSFYVPADLSAPAVAPTAEEEAGLVACSFREANCSIESRTHAIIGRHL